MSDRRNSYAIGIAARTARPTTPGRSHGERVAEVAEAAADPARTGPPRVATGSKTREPGARGRSSDPARGPPRGDSGADTTSTYCGHFVGHTSRNASPMTSHSANAAAPATAAEPDERERR